MIVVVAAVGAVRRRRFRRGFPVGSPPLGISLPGPSLHLSPIRRRDTLAVKEGGDFLAQPRWTLGVPMAPGAHGRG